MFLILYQIHLIHFVVVLMSCDLPSHQYIDFRGNYFYWPGTVFNVRCEDTLLSNLAM